MKLTRAFNKEEEIITIEQIEIILGIDIDAAQREHEYALKTLKSGSSEILLVQFCELKGLDAEEVFDCLNPPEETWTKEVECLREVESLPPEMGVASKNVLNGSTIDNQQPIDGDLSVFHKGISHRFQANGEDRSVA
ncbi:MAG: hypothetical protein Crog4KO_25910 [Crocinitomicaceae bacterium]